MIDIDDKQAGRPAAGSPLPVVVLVGVAVLVAASLLYTQEGQEEVFQLQAASSFGVDVQPADPNAIPAALSPALPPGCATCPSRANCLPGATPVALPPACATCPSLAPTPLPPSVPARASQLGAPAVPAALPPCATGSPFVPAAFPCVRR